MDELKSLSKEKQEEVMSEADSLDYPVWIDEKNKIDEVEFCSWFVNRHPMKYVGGLFYDINGIMKDERLTKEIVDVLKPYVKSNIVRKAKQIVEALRYETLADSLPKYIDRVHFRNGTYFLDSGFTTQKEFCSNRLPVNYNADAKKPVTWLKFLDDLLYPEDIVTLQEYMGYSFIPTTRAQAMFLLTGNGGEGKSRISFVCRNLLGDNMNLGSIWKLSSDRFCLADQEGMLLLVDDDMKMDALSDTAKIKATVTMEDKMDLERKGQQSYQGYLYVRLMGFGNGVLTALYDKSDGFYRRQILIKVKDKPKDRIDDRNLSEKLALETEGIALWCLEGLKRLVANGFHFTISERTRQNQEELRREEDSIMDFFLSKGYITFDKDAVCTTKDLYRAYRDYGEANVVKVRSETAFSKEVRQLASKLGIEYVKNVSIGARSARGYKGLYVNHTMKDNPFVGR